MQFTQLGEIGLAAQHDRFGPQIAARGMQRRMRAGGEVGHRRLFIDRGAAPLDEPRQSAHQLARMDGGGVFVIDRAKRARDPDALFELDLVEQLHLVGEPELLVFGISPLHRRQLLRAARDRQGAAFGKMNVETFRRRDAPDFIDCAGHGAIHRHRRVTAVMLGQRLQAGGKMA